MNNIKTSLTRCENDVLQLITQGLSAKQIGVKLFVCSRTVEFHTGHILTKLGVSNRTEATIWAIRNGLVSA